MKKCSIRDVAALAGVSISTVSRILNNHEKAKTIPPEVHKRVQECARQLEYVPNANARRVFSHRAGIIGLLVPSYRQMKMHIFEDGHLRRLISGIEEGLGENKYRLLRSTGASRSKPACRWCLPSRCRANRKRRSTM